MATAAELTSFAAKTNFSIPTVDFQAGALSGQPLQSFMTLIGTPGVAYNAKTGFISILNDNVELSGIDFRGVTVSVNANNVKVSNSIFDASFGVYSITQADGKTGLTLNQNTFDGLKLDKNFGAFVRGGTGELTLTKNAFLNAPADAVQIFNGKIDHNYFSGAGYQQGAHADSIWVGRTTGPVTITNNFIDARQAADALVSPNNAIRITGEIGAVKDVTVSNNVLLGGTYTVGIHDLNPNPVTGVQVKDNFIGGSLWGNLYPNGQPADLVYVSNGATVPGLIAAPVVVTKGITVIGNAKVAGEKLYGTDGNDWIHGNGDGDNLIGGGGRDFLFGSKGKDVFVIEKATDSLTWAADVISNFEVGVDKIDIGKLAALGTSLKFVGQKAFAGSAGEVIYYGKDGKTFVEVDLDGNKTSDVRIEIANSVKLSSSDFLLANPAPLQDKSVSFLMAVSPEQTLLSQTSLKIFGDAKVGNETLQGGNAQDWIFGTGGGDRLVGHGGRDFLFGGKGQDIFTYYKASDSAGKATDVIASFETQVDKIDLSAVRGSGEGLRFLGETAFDGKAGAVTVHKTATSTWVEADLNGDRVADMRIELQGNKVLSAVDFLL